MHIYVHVPFCARRCSYCDFAIAVRRETPDIAFADAIVREWRAWSPGLPAATSIATVYFGGGTPSHVAPETIRRILDAIGADHPLAVDAEITLEANPDDVTAGRAAAWVAAGINRVSLGVQSHEPRVLEWMHRTHTADQVPSAVRALHQAGLTNVSMDLIFALPAELERNWSDDLARTLALRPAHVSLYGLTVEPHTPLSHWTERGTAVVATDGRYAEDFLFADSMLTAAGFEHYEISNAGRPGFRSRHNWAYWSGAAYVGLGPSAHSMLNGVRSWNTREWAAYQRQSEVGQGVQAGQEVLDDAAQRLERRYLGLRTTEGLPAAGLPADLVESWCREGWATATGGRVRLTVEGWLRLDALVVAARDS